ncbi:MAG: ATP-binding cassette domain-containing protein, partial [Candidatus Zixiibacteriota bacterium]
MIQIDSLYKSYYRDSLEIPVLRNINLTVNEGEFLSLMGPSGSGKTTLLNLIAGIDKPSAGTLRVAGEDLSTLSEAKLARWRSRHIGFVFQFYNLL